MGSGGRLQHVAAPHRAHAAHIRQRPMDRTPQTSLARVLKSVVSLFCLVHGSTEDASGWDLLVSELERLGHEVARVNLPSNTPEATQRVMPTDCCSPYQRTAAVPSS